MTSTDRAQAITLRTYSRPVSDDSKILESWNQIVDRVISHQKWLWERQLNRELNETATDELNELKELILKRWVLPSGRCLWLGGTEISKIRESCMFNCAFTYLETVYDFVDLTFLLLNGCGVGFKMITGTLTGFRHPINDIQIIRSQKTKENNPKGDERNYENYNSDTRVWTIKIGDSAEAWAKAVGKLLAGKFPAKKLVIDFSQVRAAGYRLKHYGWISSGDELISKAFRSITQILSNRADSMLSKMDILDIANWIGTILSTRRSAQIALMDYGDKEWYEFSTAKRDFWVYNNHHRQQSNNSILLYKKPTEEELKNIFDIIIKNGGSEPGIINVEQALERAPWYKGGNPCVSKDTWIDTSVGRKQVNDLIDISNYDVIVEGKPYKLESNGFFYTGNKLVYKLETKSGLSVKLTNNHKIRIPDGTFVELEKLNISDKISITNYNRSNNDVDLCDTIVSVSKIGYEDVYDVTVAEVHEFSGNGIRLSNCNEILLPNKGFCNLSEINLLAFKGNPALLYRALYLVGRMNYRQTLVNFKDGILQEAWHLNNQFYRLCGVGLTGIMACPELTAYDFKRMKNCAINGAYSMAIEFGMPLPKNVTTTKPSGCSIGSSMIVTDKGILKLTEIGNVEGTQWQEHNIHVKADTGLKKSTKFYVNGKVPTLRLIMNSGSVLESTLNHKYKVLNTESNKLEWKMAQDIKINDIIPYQLNGYENCVEDYIKLKKLQIPIHHLAHKPTKQPEYLAEDIAWFVGLMYGDGNFEKCGIRIHGSIKKMPNLIKAGEIIDRNFGLNSSIHKSKKTSTEAMHINICAKFLRDWLILNSFYKPKSLELNIPLIIRQSPKSVIRAFIDGYSSADGYTYKDGCLSWSTVSETMAQELVICLRYIGIATKIRKIVRNGSSYGNNMLYQIREIKGRKGNMSKINIKCGKHIYEKLDKCGLDDYEPDFVYNIEESVAETYDIEVPDGNAYQIQGGYISHNTLSKIMGTVEIGEIPEGMHSPLGKYIFNNIGFSVHDPLVQKLKDANYDWIEKPGDPTSVLIKFPVKYDTVKFTNVNGVEVSIESAITQLERYKLLMSSWCEQNVSSTISYSKEEVPEIIKWILDNWNCYVGTAFLFRCDPTKTAKDLGFLYLPQEVVTKEDYEEYIKKLKPVDYTGIVHSDEMLDVQECSGGSCPIR